MTKPIPSKKIVCFTILSLFFPVSPATAADISEKINSIINRESQNKSIFAVNIIKSGGETIYARNAHKTMIPASTMKLVTTAAAVHYLGTNYEYITRTGLSPENDIVTVGSGDPLFGYDDYRKVLSKISSALISRGIEKINNVNVDTGVFEDKRVHPNWPKAQLNRWYACEVSGLNFNANCIEMTVTNQNGRAKVNIVPETGFIRIDNQVRTISSGRGAVGAYRVPGKINHLEVKGKVRYKQGPFKVAVQRPGAFFGYVLAEHLMNKGINIKGRLLVTNIQDEYDIEELVEFRMPISECLKKANKISLGLSAEALLKTIAAENNGGENGSWSKGRTLIREYLLSLGLTEDEFYLDDGSGLSRKNRLSPSVLTEVLSDMYQSPGKGIFYSSLATGGEDGTIARYFRDSDYKGKIRGKTGYISGVKSFAGIAQRPDGDYFFAILVNQANGATRKAINDIAKAIIDY